MNETYLAWLVLVLFVALGALSLKADACNINNSLVGVAVLILQILFSCALAIAVVFAVTWAFVTVAS
jgi:hypothetical protein